MIIEEAIVSRLIAAFPDVPIHVSDWPDDQPSPCIVYSQSAAQSTEGHYSTEHNDSFEFLIVTSAGGGSQQYRASKLMAAQVREAFGTHFDVSGDEPFCVMNVAPGTQKDQFDSRIQQHWVEAQYTFTYHTRNGTP